MTEAEWLICGDPRPMVEYVRVRASERKLRLFLCACARRIWHLLADEAARHTVEVAERFADHCTDFRELSLARTSVWVGNRLEERPPGGGAAREVVRAASARAVARAAKGGALHTWFAAELAARCTPDQTTRFKSQDIRKREQVAVCALLRDLFGNPFRPIRLDPVWTAWHEGCVLRIAQAAYAERDLPAGDLASVYPSILADALEEAGCEEADLLTHLRGPGPHVRGCWAIDLLRSVN